jgi:adenine deaminase
MVMANLADIVDGTLETRKAKRMLPVKEGKLCPDEDLLYCVVVDRYRPKGTVGIGLISGAGCMKGAFAGSVAQDTQNLIAIGHSQEEVLYALNYIIEQQGGIVFVQNRTVEKFIPLPVLGILTQDSIEHFNADVEELNTLLRKAGLTLMNPILTLSLQLPLAVIPEMAVTNRGLLDINKKQFIPVCEPM